MKKSLNLLKRSKGAGHGTTAPAGARLFTFDESGRHRKADISGEVWLSEKLLAEFGDPVSIEITFKE